LLLPVLSISNLNTARATPESTRVPTKLDRPDLNAAAGVELSSGYEQMATPGSIITYTHTLTNTGTNADTFTLDVSSSQGWPVSLSSETGTMSLPLQIDAGLTTTFLISLSVPTAVISGTVDMAGITATSQTSPTVSSSAVDITTVENTTWYVYLPLILKRWPPVPDVPVLNAINNPGNEGYYTVAWNVANLATSYTLEEDDNAAFSSPAMQYSGSGTSWFVTYNPGGTYYYRVKAINSWGESGWSNIQSTTALPGIHGRVTYQGNPIGGVTIDLRFFNGSSYSTIRTTTTQANGGYQFVSLPTLASGQQYSPLYSNSASSNYVASCRGALFTSYVADTSVSGGNFDIANIPQVSPPTGATITLPYTFQWTKRSGVPSDSYKLEIWNDNDWWETLSPLGYVSSYTLNTLPSGLSFGTPYQWDIVVNTTPTGGHCYSFDQNRTVTFSSGVADSQDSVRGARRQHNADGRR